MFANHHVPRIISLSDRDDEIEVIRKGKELRKTAIFTSSLATHVPVLVTDTPTSIGMQVPESITVRDVADLVGHSTPVNVMDVEYQEGMMCG